MTDADLKALCVRGYRFRDDRQSPPEKLTSAAELLAPYTVRVVTLTEPRPDAHSTLTGPNRNQTAVNEVIRRRGAPRRPRRGPRRGSRRPGRS
jgi:hypothetical protein